MLGGPSFYTRYTYDMNIIVALAIGLALMYGFFVAFNTFVYEQKQSESATSPTGSLEIQWGF